MQSLKTEIKWGLIMAAITLVVFTLSKFLGWQTPGTFGMHLSAAFAGFLIGYILCLWMGLREKRTSLGGNMSYTEGLKSGALIAVLSTVFGVIGLYFFICCINPDFLSAMRDFCIAEGTMTIDQEASPSSFLTEFATHSAGIGLVFSSILAFFAKSK